MNRQIVSLCVRVLCAALVLVIMGTPPVAGASDGVWQSVDRASLNPADVAAQTRPNAYRVCRVDSAELQNVLAAAPLEFSDEAKRGWAEISLPMPDGSSARFRFVESPIMAPELAAKYPSIRTYVGQGIDEPAATVRFDSTPAGFHAQILSPTGSVCIDPFGGKDATLHLSYYRSDRALPDGPWSDIVLDNPDAIRGGGGGRTGEWLLTYRLACAATGEYTVYHGGTVELGLAAIVTALNRVNGIYETDFAIRLELIANNDQIVYTDGSTDPYTNTSASDMLDENIANLDTVIGVANFDIGHVFSTSPGGISYCPCVCEDDYKAGGVTGTATPIGDPYWVDYVCHEIGHQFGANHTFNGQIDQCVERNAATAYTPGSGSTIMGYAGICGADNLQNNSDPYFHFASIGEVRDYVDSGGGYSCPQETLTGNTDPTVDAGADYTIPANTPFVLTATGSDVDGDTVTYCWEERDLGPASSLGDPDDGLIPLFRSWAPTTDPSRTFPRLEDLVQNTLSLGEQLPTTNRAMNFRCTVRDNRAGGGATAYDDMVITVIDDATGFVIDEPSDGTELWDGATANVVWTTSTENPPFNVAYVDVRLSLDGGFTYPYLLADDVNNTGFVQVNVPADLYSTTARVRLEAVGNIFFDISDNDFTVNTLPTGACCGAGAVCTIASEPECSAAGGLYQGDGTDCDPNPCPLPTLIYEWNMDTDPAWSTDGLWAWGQPTGNGGGDGGNPDPTSGYTGNNVYGYNLDGDYEAELDETYLTTTAIDCSELHFVSVSFYRWLNIETSDWDHAAFHVSNDGTTWTELWANPSSNVFDAAWTYQEFDLSAYANGQATVYLRWTMGTTDDLYQFSGWNIDDVEIQAVSLNQTGACCHADYTCEDLTEADCTAAGGSYLGDDTVCTDDNANGFGDECECHGDADCDGVINFNDIDYFVAALVAEANWEALFTGTPPCDYLHNDANWDGNVNFDDIDPFVDALVGGDCVAKP